MGKPEKSIQDLIEMHGQEWKSLLYPFLVLRVINEHGKASSLEIKSQIIDWAGEKAQPIGGKKVEYNYTAYYRLMARLEHEVGLIEPVDLKKDKGPARVYFGLTAKGRELYDELLKQVIYPVQRLLPKEQT